MNKLEIGSISHGTLVLEDLWDALYSTAESLDLPQQQAIQLGVLSERWDHVCDDEDQSAALETFDNLADLLIEAVPPFCYIGMHEGDGSDLGCWFSSEGFEEAVADGEVLKTDSCPDYVAVISDHGNIELYSLTPVLGVT